MRKDRYLQLRVFICSHIISYVLILLFFLGQEKENIKSDVHAKGNSLLSVLQSSPVTSTNGCVIIIDSLTPVIYNIGFTRCYRELHSLLVKSTNGEQNIVAVLFYLISLTQIS
jgi:hypothetical protein